MKTACPACQASDKTKKENIGKKIKCWRCGEWYIISEGIGTYSNKYLPIGLGIVVAALILYYLSSLLLRTPSDGGLGDFTYYLPENTEAIGYWNLRKLRDGKPYEELAKELAYEARAKMLDLDAEDIEKIWLVFPGNGRCVVLIKTAQDYDLKDVVKDPSGEIETYRDMEYVQTAQGHRLNEYLMHSRRQIFDYPSQAGYVAKIDKSSYCFAVEENDLQDILSCVSRREKSHLHQDLQQATEHVSKEDSYFAGLGTRFSPIGVSGGEAQATAIGLSVGSTIRIRGTLVFKDETQAQKWVEDHWNPLEKMFQSIEIRPSIKESEKKEAKTIRNVMQAQRVSRSGTQCLFKWNIDAGATEYGAIRDLLIRHWHSVASCCPMVEKSE